MLKSSAKVWALHGFLGHASDWKEFDVEAVEIKPEKSIKDWAEKFNAQILLEDHVESRFLIGYSMGGRLALAALLNNPSLWSRVYLISTHPGLSENHLQRVDQDEKWAVRFENDPWYEVVADWMAQPIFKGSRSPLRLESDFDRAELAAFLRNFSLGKQKPLTDLEKAILKEKAIFFVGEKDEIALLQNPDALVVPGSGHRILFDNPSYLQEALLLAQEG